MTPEQQTPVTDIFPLCVELLYGREVEPHDPIHLKIEFEDRKLYILGVLHSNGLEYHNLTVHLKMPEESATVRETATRVQFGIPKTNNDAMTIVFVWQGRPRFYRPGYWVMYLKQLVEDLKHKRDDFLRFNDVPVNDARLFPEFSELSNQQDTTH